MEGQGGGGLEYLGFGGGARFGRQGLSGGFPSLSSISHSRDLFTHFVCQVLFSVLRRNNPSWFNGESTRYWRLPRGTITDHTEAHDDNDGGRYRDEPTERPTRRLAESDVENERVV